MTNKLFYEWIVDLSNNEDFKATTPLSDDKYSEQYNLELIVRFLVFYSQDWNGITSGVISDIGEFLNDKIVTIAQDTTFDKNNVTTIFSKSFDLINTALGADAFKKYYKAENKHKGGFSIALFEAISIGVALNIDRISKNLTPAKLKAKIEQFSIGTDFTSFSGSGVRGNTRVAKIIPYAIQFFSK